MASFPSSIAIAVSGENVNQADTSEDTQQPDGAGDSDSLVTEASVEGEVVETEPQVASDEPGSSDEAGSADESPAAEVTEEAKAKAPAPPPPAPAKAAAPVQEPEAEEEGTMEWYILKVAFNREDSIAENLRKRLKMEGLEEFFGDVVVPTEDVATFTRDGKRRVSKRKLLPGYIMVYMLINDDTWFLVRETSGISDFTGAAGKPMPMEANDIERFVTRPTVSEEEEAPIKIGIPFRAGDRVRIKEGNFENQEGDVDAVDEDNGRITVIINIFGRSVPMELDHWQVEPL